MELNYKSIGARIKSTRMDKGVSQDYLATKAHISAQHLSLVENGKTKLSLQCLVNLCNVLGISTDTILLDNVRASNPYVLGELSYLLSDCNADELYIICQMANAIKQSLRARAGMLTAVVGKVENPESQTSQAEQENPTSEADPSATDNQPTQTSIATLESQPIPDNENP